MQTKRCVRSLFALLLTLALLAGMVSVMGALPTAAKTTDAMKFKADFGDLAAIANKAGAFGEGTFYRPGYTADVDKDIMAWVDAKFDLVSGYGKSMNRTYLGQSSSTLSTSKDTWSGENYWSILNDGSLKQTTLASGQMLRLVEAFVPQFDGKDATLSNFEAKMTFAIGATAGQGQGFVIAFHEDTAGYVRVTGDHRLQDSGSMVVVGNGGGNYVKNARFGMSVYDHNNTLGKEGKKVYAATASVISNEKGGTDTSDNALANLNIDGEMFAEGKDLAVGTKYDLIVKVVGTALTATVKETATGTVVYTREKTLEAADTGYISFGASNGNNQIYAIEITELDENGNAVDFGTKTGKDAVETLKIDFSDVPEVQWYNGKYYYNAGYDTHDVNAAVDMATDFLTAESTTHVISTKEQILTDYLESKLGFYYSQEGQSFERPNVNGYAVSDAGVEYTSKTGNVNAYAPDTKVSLGKYVDGIGYSGNSGNGIAKWYLDGNKYLAYTNNGKNGDGMFRKAGSIAIKDKNGDLLQIDNFKLDFDFKAYADGTYGYSNIAVGFHADQPYLERGRQTQGLFAISPQGGYFLGDNFSLTAGKIFNKTTGGYDDFTTETAINFMNQTTGNTATSTRAAIYPYVSETKVGHNALAHLTLTVVGNTVTAKATMGDTVILEKTETLNTYVGSGYLWLSGSNQQGWYQNIEVTRLDVNGNPVDFSDDNEGFTFGESFDAKATYYYKDSKFWRNTGADMFWMAGGNAITYNFDAPATYADDADTVAHLNEKFDFYATREAAWAKLATPYQKTEENATLKESWSEGVGKSAYWVYTTAGLTMLNTECGGETMRKTLILTPKVNGAPVFTTNLEFSTDLVLPANSNGAVTVSLRSKQQGRTHNANSNTGNSYAGHIALQLMYNGIDVKDGKRVSIDYEADNGNGISASTTRSAWSDGASHTNVRLYVKLVNDKMTVKVTDTKTGAVIYTVTDQTVSYNKPGYVNVGIGQKSGSIANLYVRQLDGSGVQIDPALPSNATNRYSSEFNTSYNGYFMYNSAALQDARLPAILRSAKNLNGLDYFGTYDAGYSHQSILSRNVKTTYLLSEGYTLTTGEATVLKDVSGKQIASTAEPGIASIALVENAEDATQNAYVITFDTDYLNRLVKELSKELFSYLDSKFEWYYTDVSTYKGHASDNHWGYEAGSIYVNEYLQFHNSTAAAADTAIDKNISLLVPKDVDGAALFGKNFSWSQVVRLDDSTNYSTAYLAFNMPTPGKLGGAKLSNQAITFDANVNAIRMNGTQFQLWNGTRWLDIAGGYAPGKTVVTVNLNVNDGVLTGNVKYGSTTITLTETTLANTQAGYFGLGLNYGGVHLGKTALDVKDPKKLVTAQQSEGGEITVTRVTSDKEGVYKYAVTAKADEGYELKVGSLLGTDENNETVYPADRVGFQSATDSGNTFYFYCATDMTVKAEFYTVRNVQQLNIANLGTSFHEGSGGLRFVSRVGSETDENGVRYVRIDGKKYELQDYGMILTSQAALDWGTANGKGAELVLGSDNPYIRPVSVMKEQKFYDACATYMDISTRIIGLDEVKNGYDLRLHGRAYVTVKLADGSTETVYTDTFASTYRETSELLDTVYVDSTNGADTNAGTAAAPVATFEAATKKVMNNGNIVLNGNVTADSSYLGSASGKPINVSGGTLTVSYDTVNVTSPITFSGMTLVFKDGGTLYANGYPFTVEDTVTVNGTLNYVYGGSDGKYVDFTNLTLNAGNYYNIYGGCNNADVGTTEVTVGGNVNAALKSEGQSSHNVRIIGSSNGAGKAADVTNVTLNGGYAYMIYGGGLNATATETYVTVNGGEVAQVFGGNEGCSLTGNTDVQILGGTVTRRIYGGCYNNATRSGLSLTWATTYHVIGNTRVTLSGNADVTCTGDAECGIWATSRYKSLFADEKSTICYVDAAAKREFENRLGAQGWVSVLGYCSSNSEGAIVLG